MREYEIKRALTQYLVHESVEGERAFIEELPVNGGEVRADLVRIDDMHCFEIKSETDSLRRLVGQGSRYARVFDHVTLVVATKHLEKAKPMLPPWWGILLIPDEHGKPFQQIRKAKPNKRHEPLILASLLNKDEALNILVQHGVTRGFKSKSLYLIHEKIVSLLSLDELKNYVQQSLTMRCV